MDCLNLVCIIGERIHIFTSVVWQAEESEIEEQIKELEFAVDHVKSVLSRLFFHSVFCYHLVILY